MTLNKKVFFITTGATTLAIIAIIVVLLLNIRTFKPQIEAAASNALGMEVRIKGKVGITLFPGIGISLKDISVRNGGADVITVEKMKIGLQFIALTKREVGISRIGLTRPVFSIVRHKNGTFNFEKPGSVTSGRTLAVEKISISQGSIFYIDESSSERVKLDDLEVTVQNLSYHGADGEKPFKNISFDGAIKCKRLLINEFTVTNLAMMTAAENGIFDINPVSMDIFGRTGKGSIHVDVTGASPHFQVSAALNRFPIEEMIQAFSPGNIAQKSIEGTVSFSAHLAATGKSADEVKRSLNGDFSLNGEDLMLYGIDIDALVPKYERSQNFNLVDVGAYFLAGPFGPLLTKTYNFGSLYKESRGGKGSISKLVSRWKVKNGIAGATDVALASKKYRIAMQGGLNFNNDRFEDVTVAVLDKRGCAVYSQKVHGLFREPHVEKVNIFKSITGPVSNVLEDARQFIHGEKCAVFYSGSVAQPEG